MKNVISEKESSIQYNISIYKKYSSKVPSKGVWLEFDYSYIIMVEDKPVLGASKNNTYTKTPDGHNFGGWQVYTLEGETDGQSISRETIERYAYEHYLENYVQ